MLETSDTPRRRLGVFVSSAMQELKAERQIIKLVLEELKIDAWVYESDAGARDQNTRTTYLQELKAADLYIGVFWKRYGPFTIDEYRQAELCCNSMDALKKGTATPAFKKVGDDLPKFATGGLTALIGEQQ